MECPAQAGNVKYPYVDASMRGKFGEIEPGSIKTFNRTLATLWFAVRAMSGNRRAFDLSEQRREHDEPTAA